MFKSKNYSGLVFRLYRRKQLGVAANKLDSNVRTNLFKGKIKTTLLVFYLLSFPLLYGMRPTLHLFFFFPPGSQGLLLVYPINIIKILLLLNCGTFYLKIWIFVRVGNKIWHYNIRDRGQVTKNSSSFSDHRGVEEVSRLVVNAEKHPHQCFKPSSFNLRKRTLGWEY